MVTLNQARPCLHGVGLRRQHYQEWLSGGPRVGVVEAISENFAGRGGRPLAVLERVRRDHAVALHGVSLSLGSCDRLRIEALRDIATLAARIEAAWVSEHLSFGTFEGQAGHDLWPLPFTEEAIRHVVPRISQAQEILQRRLALENIATYVRFRSDEMPEWQFLVEVAERADCEILLDLNNLHINASNHEFDAQSFLEALPTARIRQLHLAGHEDLGTHLFDNHGASVAEPVWNLYRHCLAVHGPIPCVVEWDMDVPPLEVLLAESRRAAAVESVVLGYLKPAAFRGAEA